MRIHAIFQWVASLFGRRPTTDRPTDQAPVEGDQAAIDLLNRAYGPTIEFTEWEEDPPSIDTR